MTTQKQIYKQLDKAMERVILHSNALLNHPDATDSDLRRTVLDLREGVKQADARLYAAISEAFK